MIELNIIEEQYARMPNEELIRFAMNESMHLTIDSFHLLKIEFEKRGLDISILESAEIDEALSNITKQTTFERVTAFEFTEAIWKNALDEKAEGKSNMEVYDNLLKRGVNEEYAFMLIQSLDIKAKDLIKDSDNGIIAGWIFIFIGIIAAILSMNDGISQLYIFYALAALVTGGIKLYRNYSNKEKYLNVCKNITAEQLDDASELHKLNNLSNN